MTTTINGLRGHEPETHVRFRFDDPFVGPFGYAGEKLAVHGVTVTFVGNRVTRVTGEGWNVKRDGRLGLVHRLAYNLCWADLPEDVRGRVIAEWRTVVDRLIERKDDNPVVIA